MLNQKQIAEIQAALKAEDDTALLLVFRSLGDPCRFKIFRALIHHPNLCVTDIAKIFGITLSAASQQLRFLEQLGLVVKKRSGQLVCHQLNQSNPTVRKLTKFLAAKKGKLQTQAK